MFLTELRVEADKDSETCLIVTSPVCGDVAVSAPTTHERNNWLKKIAIAQKHIIDTERSILHRQQSSKYIFLFYLLFIVLYFIYLTIFPCKIQFSHGRYNPKKYSESSVRKIFNEMTKCKARFILNLLTEIKIQTPKAQYARDAV